MAWRGKFKALNPKKYQGDPKGIIYRSSLEFKFMRYLDRHPDVLKWASEEMHVKYYDPSAKKVRRYFPDMIVQKKNKEGKIENVMIEIKPSSQCVPPKRGKTLKAQRRFLRETRTYATNIAKWEAASLFCKEHGWKFQILTEKDLGVKY